MQQIEKGVYFIEDTFPEVYVSEGYQYSESWQQEVLVGRIVGFQCQVKDSMKQYIGDTHEFFGMGTAYGPDLIPVGVDLIKVQ